MEYDVQVRRLDSCPLAVVRRRATTGQLASVVPTACGFVWSVLRAQQIAGAGRHVAIYLDDRINLEVGVELDAPFAGHGEVIGSSTPAGAVAMTTHYGSYGLLGEAHDAIRQWCRSHGYGLAGPSWEIYGHWKNEWNDDPTLVRTDVHYLLSLGTSAA